MTSKATIIAKLRNRPTRGPVKLSFADADLLLLLLGARSLTPEERATYKVQVDVRRRELTRKREIPLTMLLREEAA